MSLDKTQPCADEFEPDFQDALQQAASVQFAALPNLCGFGRPLHLLILARRTWMDAPEGFACDADGQRQGVEIAAYCCDEAGAVQDTERRYTERGPDSSTAVYRLQAKLANGLAHLDAPHAEFCTWDDLLFPTLDLSDLPDL